MSEEKNSSRNVWIGIVIVVIAIASLWVWLASSSSSSTDSQASCYSASEANGHIGSHGCVTFTVGYTYKSAAGNIFLDEYEDYSKGFAVYIPTGSSASGVTASDYDGKEVTVTGDITTYKGGTQIEVTDTSQLKTN